MTKSAEEVIGNRTSWQSLQRALMDHLTICRHFLEMVEEKQRLIIAGDLTGLQDLVPFEDKALTSLKKQMSEYQRQMQELASLNGQSDPKLTLTGLFAAAPEREQGSGSEIIRALKMVLEQIEQVNHENRELLRVSTLFNRQMLGALLPDYRQLKVYDSSGQMQDKSTVIKRMDKQI